MTRRIYISLILAVCLACQSDENALDPSRPGYNFFPLKVGAWNVYDVKEITYASQTGTTANFQLRTEVVDSFMNQAGGITYILYEWERESSADEWEFVRTLNSQRTGTQGVLTEGNTPFLKLSFPLQAGKTWDGNALNTLQDDEYEMDSLFHEYVTAAGETIAETLTVIQEDNEDFTVNLIRRFEIYGWDIGVVYREETDLNYCIEEDCIGQQIVESGREFRQSLVEYGQN